MPLLDGKTAIIFGVANKRSIAWAIAQALSREGMRLAFTYQGERLKEGVESLSSTLPGSLILPCDVTNDAEIDAVYREVDEKFGRLDALVHSVAFAPREDLENDFVKTSREGFKTSHDISAYSLVGLTRAALPLFEKSGGGCVLAMSYYGAVKAVEGYNVMGVAKASLEATVRYLAANLGPQNIRVNAISAGAIKTLAAAGISGFSSILQVYRDRAPLRRGVDQSEVADTAAFLLGPGGRGITGEIIMVDAGYHAVGV
jgi:enoyl-[acyl-carrier protein] reductase I